MTRYATPVIRRLALAALLPAALVAGCTPAAASAATAGHGLKQVRDPGKVTGTLHGHCTYRDKGQLPDPRCTPGSIDPIVTQSDIRSTICKKGWTKTVRPPESQTEKFKFGEAYPAYGTPRSEKTELDHLVSLELGGSNDATNLWPEYPPTPNPKDKVEGALNAAVCEGRVSLAAAQDAIAADWLTAEKRLGVRRHERRYVHLRVLRRDQREGLERRRGRRRGGGTVSRHWVGDNTTPGASVRSESGTSWPVHAPRHRK